MTDFEWAVYEAVKKIPKGKVASYGQISLMAGHPGASRAVGNILHKNPDPKNIPCFKVVHSDGRLTGAFAFGGIYRHKELLVEDGVEVVNFKVDMKKYQMK